MKLSTKILCGFLGWHKPDNTQIYMDEVNVHSICKYCRREIMLDSQGNWFERIDIA
jgi:hypothetical protein